MSERAPSASRGLAFNLGSAVLPLVGSFIVSILLAPYLGATAWGEYSLVLSAATLLLIVAKFGIHAATSRLLSENEDDPGPWLRAGLFWRAIFTLGTTAVAIASAPWLARSFGIEGGAGPFWFVGPIVLAVSAFEWATESLVGLRSFRAQMTTRLVALALRLSTVGVVVGAGLGLGAFLLGHSLAQAIPAAVVLAILLTRHGVKQPNSDARRRTLELALPLAFSSASFLVYSHTDRMMLGWFHDPAMVGQFAVARNVLDAAMFPTAALAWTLRPALVRAVAGRTTLSVAETLREGMRLSAIYVSIAVAGLLVLGPSLVDGLYRGQYAEGAHLLLWLLPVLALRAMGTVLFPALIALDRQNVYARLMVLTAIVNVVANLALIPRFGARGAIVATIIALSVLTFGGFAELRRAVEPPSKLVDRRSLILAVVLLIGVGALLWPLRSASLLVQIGIAVPICLAAALGPLMRQPSRIGR